VSIADIVHFPAARPAGKDHYDDKGADMTREKDKTEESKQYTEDEDDAIVEGFEQMEMIYKSRCVQMPVGSNVTVREIKKEE